MRAIQTCLLLLAATIPAVATAQSIVTVRGTCRVAQRSPACDDETRQNVVVVRQRSSREARTTVRSHDRGSVELASGRDHTGVAAKGAMDTVEVVGPVELSRAEAIAAAEAEARTLWEDRARETARSTLERAAPIWLPGFARERAFDRWLSGHRAGPRIVERDLVERDHGFGTSYQATLEVALWDGALPGQQAKRELGHELAVVKRRFLGTCGGTLVFWILSGLAFSWLDRLSRGYMTGRLRLLFLLLGVGLPSIAFLAI